MIRAWRKVIKNMRPGEMQDDEIQGLKTMLRNERFKSLHELIRLKLAEKKSDTEKKPLVPEGSFSLKYGKFYKTRNGSIVTTITKDDLPEDYWRVLVIQGGLKVEQHPLEILMNGSFNLGYAYVIDKLGRVFPLEEKKNPGDEKHPMDIMQEIHLTFSEGA